MAATYCAAFLIFQQVRRVTHDTFSGNRSPDSPAGQQQGRTVFGFQTSSSSRMLSGRYVSASRIADHRIFDFAIAFQSCCAMLAREVSASVETE